MTAPFAPVPGLSAARQEAGNPARVRDLQFCSFSIHSVSRPRDASPSTFYKQRLLQSVEHRVGGRGVGRCLLRVL